MKAIIAGTPLELEGEPAEIAQLVELIASGAVLVEHKHRWRLGDADDAGVQQGACWCGQTRDFAPWAETLLSVAGSRGAAASVAMREAKKTRGGKNPCSVCGGSGHNKRTCPQRAAA